MSGLIKTISLCRNAFAIDKCLYQILKRFLLNLLGYGKHQLEISSKSSIRSTQKYPHYIRSNNILNAFW